MRMLFVAVTLVMTTHAAMAADLPRYDVEGYCNEVVEFSGGGHSLFNGCIKMEQQAYNALKSDWAQIPDDTQQYCMEVSEFSDAAYSLLKGCIDNEISEASNRQQFSF